MLDDALVLLLVLLSLVDLVGRRTAPLLLDVCGEPESLGPAAWVIAFVAAVLELRLLRVVPTVVELAAHELRLAHCALQGYQSCPDLPVDVLPLDVLLVVHVLNKAVEVKEAVSDVLCDHLSVKIYEDLGVRAHHPLILLASVQLPTVNTPREQC